MLTTNSLKHSPAFHLLYACLAVYTLALSYILVPAVAGMLPAPPFLFAQAH